MFDINSIYFLSFKLFGFLKIGIADIFDVLLVAFLIYQLYKLLRGSLAFNIFLGLLIVYLAYAIVYALDMEMLASILKQFVDAGFIMLVIVFQPEIRRFLFYIGRGSGIGKGKFWQRLLKKRTQNEVVLHKIKDEIVRAVTRMAATRTGALIVFVDPSEKTFFAQTGVAINGDVSSKLLESIFDKNTPLHDGALVISDYKILSAGCVLPVSENPDIPSRVGMRHRAAVGVSEQVDADVIVISEERGKISWVKSGKMQMNISNATLKSLVEDALRKM